VGAARAWVEGRFGVRYTYWGIRTVFARLQLEKKVPRPLAKEASPEAQEAWKRGASRAS
jgi:transposase